MKIGMNLLLWSTHITEDQFDLFKTLKDVGYDGVEVPLFEGEVAHYEKVGQALSDAGMGASCVTVATPDADPRKGDQAAIDHIKWALDCTKACGGDVLCGPYHQPLGEFTGEPPTDAEREAAATVHRAAADYAQSVGVKMAMEYLNRFECYMFNTIADAAAHVKRVNHPAFGTMYDTFHANIEEKDGPAGIRAAGDAIIHFHVSANDRGTPGKAHIDYLSAFKALKDINYDGWMTIEAFGRALPDLAAATKVWRDFFPNKEEVYTEGLKLIKETWAAAG
jgi:D-psicose/D-tagatose/L-ribulose 3-epimerase